MDLYTALRLIRALGCPCLQVIENEAEQPLRAVPRGQLCLQLFWQVGQVWCSRVAESRRGTLCEVSRQSSNMLGVMMYNVERSVIETSEDFVVGRVIVVTAAAAPIVVVGPRG